MASTINTTNIDTTFPIAGQDNDSQGFRDNFTNTNTNFIAAKEELEDLQNKVILKSPLLGGSLDNDMANALISNAQYKGFRGAIEAHGDQLGGVAIDVSTAPYQKLTATGAISLSFNSWSPAGTHSAVRLQILITDPVVQTVTLPGAASLGLSGLQNIDTGVITFIAAGTYIFEFSSTDEGASISVNDLSQPRIANRQELVAVPGSTNGVLGDLKGMVAWDGTYIYLCTDDYTGGAIWVRTAAATW